MKDKKGGLAKTHKKSLEVINSYCEDLDIIGVCRKQNPEQRRFTWRQKNPEIQWRLFSRKSMQLNQYRQSLVITQIIHWSQCKFRRITT